MTSCVSYPLVRNTWKGICVGSADCEVPTLQTRTLKHSGQHTECHTQVARPHPPALDPHIMRVFLRAPAPSYRRAASGLGARSIPCPRSPFPRTLSPVCSLGLQNPQGFLRPGPSAIFLSPAFVVASLGWGLSMLALLPTLHVVERAERADGARVCQAPRPVLPTAGTGRSTGTWSPVR